MEIPHAARPREVLRGYLGALGLRHPPHLPRAVAPRGARAGWAPSPEARVAGRSELGPARGIPAERRRQGDGGGDRRPGLPGAGRSGQVQSQPLPADPSRDPRGLYPPWDPHRAPRARDPARDPTHPEPSTPALRAPGSSTGSVASPSPPPPPQRPQRPHAPHVPSRPAAAPVPAVAAARPPPSLCRRRSEPHTHRYTQPLTSPGPRPAHVTAETRLPADAAAVSGRPGNSEGGGRRRGGNEASGAARPRASQSLGRARRLAYCGSSRAARSRLSAPPLPGRAPGASAAHARAPALPRPLPRACPALLARRAVWAAGARRCLRCPAQTGCSLGPTPAALLPSSSRPAGCLGPPPPRPPPCGDGPDPGAPWPLGRRAAGGGGGGRARQAALCATPAAGGARGQARPPSQPPLRAAAGRPAPPRRWPAGGSPPRPLG